MYLLDELDFQLCEKFKQLMKHMKLKKEQKIMQEMLKFAKQITTGGRLNINM